MATPVCRHSSSLQWLSFLRFSSLSLLLCTLLVPPSFAHPVQPSPLHVSHPYQLSPRGFVINNSTGIPQVFDSTTHQSVPQGPATDGGGTGFDLAAIIWLAFSFAVGPPMAIAGIRMWRITTGVGIGLAAAVCSWAALVNTINNNGLPDAVLTAIVLGFFVVGFVFGLFEIGRIAGISLLGIIGGLAFGARAVIIRPALLIPNVNLFFANWMVVTLFGVLGGAIIVSQKTQRAGILIGSASVGTFFIALGVDFILNRQSGMSRGLRFLFDRNASHVLDIIGGGYTPALRTQITLAVSLGLTPILAFFQHRAFQQPFSRKRLEPEMVQLPDFFEDKDAQRASRRQTFLGNLWNGAQTIKAVATLQRSRFSL
ncbi:hypothetical protein C0993_005286 [Termitomyces sp. T159_Od127]|nr:hypothetical protein C0993_005286 [Termitomyces sp. T159_Od127]